MKYVLDTDILIDLEKAMPNLIDIINKLTGTLELSDFNITFINLFEFLLGIKVRSSKNQAQAKNFIDKFWVLHTSNKTSELLTDLKFKYDKKGIILSLADLIIASIVIENNLTLVTRDRDFEKIAELKKIII